MKPTPLLVALSAVFVLAACKKESRDNPAERNPATGGPERQVVKNTTLLTEPEDDVCKPAKTAADYPALKVANVKPGEGEDTLDWTETGVFHIRGSLASGKEFKNTKRAGASETILMIDCGDLEGLVLGVHGMKVGEVRTLQVPPELAYGEAGDPLNGVPANANLFLTAELVEIQAALPPEFLIRRKVAGAGTPIRVGQRGSFHYTGILGEGERAGEQFDSSRPQNRPFQTAVGPTGQVIEGWQKGLIGMRVGEKRWLKVPSKMAYGASGKGQDIPPNATLIFEVELVSIDG